MGKMNMFQFTSPWMILLLFLPVFVRYLFPGKKSLEKHNAGILFPYLRILKETFGGTIPKNKFVIPLFLILLSGFWFFLVIALMNPQIVNKMQNIQSEGHDIMLAVDLSGSMRALDFSSLGKEINRLDVAKKVVGRFVKARDQDRIGLIVFGNFAFQYAPLTLDRSSVSKMLNDTVISMAGDGTAIGDAIGLAVKSLKERSEKSRILILLTDGEDTASSIPPVQAALLAKQYGIKIYAIGIGSDGLVPFPDDYGGIGLARMKLDEKLLTQIATTTGGLFFQATDENALQKIYDKIDSIEKTKAQTQAFVIRTPLYRYPLGIALLFLGILALYPILYRLFYMITHGGSFHAQ